MFSCCIFQNSVLYFYNLGSSLATLAWMYFGIFISILMVTSCICKVRKCPCLKHQDGQCEAAVNKAGGMCAGCKLQVPFVPVGGLLFGPRQVHYDGHRACGDGPLPLPCSLPAPRALDVSVTATLIHRVWLNFTDMPCLLSPLYVDCLQLWSIFEENPRGHLAVYSGELASNYVSCSFD